MPDHPPAVRLRLSGPRFVSILAAIVGCLILLSFLTLFLRIYTTAAQTSLGSNLIYWFNTDVESNIPALFSGFLLITAAALLAIVAACASARKETFRRYWWTLAAMFLYLACDEVGQLHERFSAGLPKQFKAAGVEAPSWMHWAWVLPALVIVTVVGTLFLRMVLSLPKQTRNLFFLSGIMYVGGALGMEMLGGHLETLYGHGPEVLLESAVEETLEMTGILLFIHALVGYLGQTSPAIRIELSPPAPQAAEQEYRKAA
ncbi:MAG: hypothetical protein WD768_19545 [Phycisphaeraceae bacterium]